MAKRRTTEEIIAAVQEELAQKQARLDKLLKDQQKKDDKARTNRLCKRHGYIESVLPDLIRLTDEQFNLFVKRALQSEFAKRTLKEILPPEEPKNGTGTAQGGEPNAQKPTGAAAQLTLDLADKPPQSPQNNGTATPQNGNGASAH
jgi:hypothetical protein